MKNIYFLTKYNKIFFFIALFFISAIKVNAQCSFPSGTTNAKETITFCIDNSNTVTTTNYYTAGEYAAVNVVKGFNYTFGFPDAFSSQSITLFNALDTSTALASANGKNAVSIDWPATFSGLLYVYISKGDCKNNAPSNQNAKIAITLNSLGNSLDSQTTFGTNTWIGHVYNHTDGPPPGGSTSPTSPSTTTSPFLSSNYVGYYTVGSETINEGFGGSYNCFPVYSNGVVRTSVYTELFSVRYRMRSTRAAGCYFLNVNGDDGIRVYVDGVLVFDQWKQQGDTPYCNNLIYLNGNSDIVLDYYEHKGGNVVGFSLTPFDGSTNFISSSTVVKVCSGVSPGMIDGSTLGNCGGGTNTVYQWQVSTDNVAFTDISGANSEDYTPPTVTTLTSNVINYYRRVLKAFATNASSCSFNSSSVKVTTSPGAATFTAAPSSCTFLNTDVTYTTQSGMTNYVWSLPGALGTDYTITSGSTGTTSNTVTLKWLTSGSKTVTVNYTSGCSGTTAASNTTVIISAPTIGTVTNANCVTPTGSVVLSGLPSGNWTINASPNTTALTGVSGSNSSTTVGGLTANTTYKFTVTNATGCMSLATANVFISPVVTTTYTGSTWSTTPDNTMIGIINSNSPIASDVNLCNCTVNAGTDAVVNSGVTLNLVDKLTVSAAGSLTFEDTSSLVQKNAVVNSGSIKYKRQTATSVRNTDYTYWSTPVSPLKLAGTGGILYSPSNLAGSMFLSFAVTATTEDWQSETAGTIMKVGEGYIIRAAGPISAIPPSTLQATFVGTPNNGDVVILAPNPYASYLLGNPYPSAINGDQFLLQNSSVLDGTLYFWTHNTQVAIGVNNPGTGLFAYTQDDYASYNLTGGVGTQQADSDPNASGMGKIPTGKIAAGQGFFVTSQTNGTIVFNNGMRVGSTSGNNAQFFKQTTVKGKTTNEIDKSRVWLNLTNEQGAFKQTLIGYVAGATNSYDNAYDGETWDFQEYIDFYSINKDKNLVIQGRTLPFDNADEVPLGYRSTIEGVFSISIEQKDGLFTSQSVFLEDKLTNSITNLSNGKYDFTTAKGVFNDRFVLRYTDKTLDVNEIDAIENGIYISNANKQIKINSTAEQIRNVKVFDLSGRLIFQDVKVDSNQLVISDIVAAQQVLLVKVTLLDGVVVTKKVIY